MTFLNLALAFGAAACAIPLVIHLLNRRRFKVVNWGAMHLLEQVARINRKRIRIEQLILLLVRMAIPVLLALCLAGPVLTGCQPLSGDAKTSLVVLIDNSYSMEAGDDQTKLDRAKQEAADVIRRQPRGSDLSVALMAGGSIRGAKSPTTDLARASEQIEKLSGGFGGADVTRSLESTAKALAKMQNAKRDIVIVSDFQAADWMGDSAAARQRAMELIEAMPLQPSVTLMQVGKHVNDNVCIHSIDISPRVIGSNQIVQVRANLKNFGERSYPAQRVFLRVDGEDQESTEIDLGPEEDGQVVFRHTFQEAGSHVVEVFADTDSLVADNRYLVAVQVWDRVPVLLVNGDPSTEPLKGETDFLEVALSPFATMAGENAEHLTDLIETKTISPHELSEDTLNEPRVVVLANVARLTDAQLEALKSFVRRGNSLLIFPGDQIDIAWYNSALSDAGSGLLPFELAKLRTADQQLDLQITPVGFKPGATSPSTAAVNIAVDHFDHPALELFNEKRNGNLAEGKITAWYQLGPLYDGPSSSANRPAVIVLARLDTGDPFLVEKQFGRGRVMQCATSCDDAWSNLPMRPFYLPLTQRLITYLASSVEPPRNVPVGESLVALLPDNSTTKTVTLTMPDGKDVQLSVRNKGDRKTVEHTDTDQTGLYTMKMPGTEPVHFIVSGSRDESDLTQLDEDELQSLADSMSASVVASSDEYFNLDSTRRYGREIWRLLFWALLVFLVAELVLQQMFSGKLKIGKRRVTSGRA